MPTGDRYERPQVNIVDRTDGGDWAVRTMGEEVKEKERRARIRDARKRHFSAIVQITYSQCRPIRREIKLKVRKGLLDLQTSLVVSSLYM